ncbi:hypothetical protein HRI_001040900 [Hibiscus trionum]|uniref:CP12 domain-containing protein n=1 Tax=Hibiscus trionum TaxID=183268 RepID=A0A9W7LRW6_HIBTR|nr:hypothetical protein HRI_001040900 [Hibiscus trionum]
MATLFSLSLAAPRMVASLPDSTKSSTVKAAYQPWKRVIPVGCKRIVAVKASPDSISEKVEQSIKEAQEACSDDPASGECVAAWDEVEELSAAASHARDRQNDNDPLENYCKDNPETDECKTYDN